MKKAALSQINRPDIQAISERIGAIADRQSSNYDVKIKGRHPKNRIPFKGFWYYLLYMNDKEGLLPLPPKSLADSISYSDAMLISLFLNVIDYESPDSDEYRRFKKVLDNWPVWAVDYASAMRRLFDMRMERAVEFVLISFPGADKLTDDEFVFLVSEIYPTFKSLKAHTVKVTRSRIIKTMLEDWDYWAMTREAMADFLSLGQGKSLPLLQRGYAR